MKTRKLILSIAGVVLATISFGQNVSMNSNLQPSDLKIKEVSNHNQEAVFYTAQYNESVDRLEHWINYIPALKRSKAQKKIEFTPVVSRRYFAMDVDLIHEEEYGLETWMTVPFYYSSPEEPVEMESWMATPFESTILDEDLSVETWMTTPFKIDEESEVEEWMTASWL